MHGQSALFSARGAVSLSLFVMILIGACYFFIVISNCLVFLFFFVLLFFGYALSNVPCLIQSFIASFIS